MEEDPETVAEDLTPVGLPSGTSADELEIILVPRGLPEVERDPKTRRKYEEDEDSEFEEEPKGSEGPIEEESEEGDPEDSEEEPAGPTVTPVGRVQPPAGEELVLPWICSYRCRSGRRRRGNPRRRSSE